MLVIQQIVMWRCLCQRKDSAKSHTVCWPPNPLHATHGNSQRHSSDVSVGVVVVFFLRSYRVLLSTTEAGQEPGATVVLTAVHTSMVRVSRAPPLCTGRWQGRNNTLVGSHGEGKACEPVSTQQQDVIGVRLWKGMHLTAVSIACLVVGHAWNATGQAGEAGHPIAQLTVVICSDVGAVGHCTEGQRSWKASAGSRNGMHADGSGGQQARRLLGRWVGRQVGW